MKYVISDEELNEFVKNPLAYKFTDDFLKSKSPVEEIAEDYLHTYAHFDKYGGKKYKIYIEVIK